VIDLDPAPIAVTIGAEPPNPSNQTSANFSFSVNDNVSTVRCKLDGGAFGLCTTPTTQSYTGLTNGSHTFTVQATDAAGNNVTGSYTWTISIPAPTVSITTPANNAVFNQHKVVNAAYSCTADPATTLTSCAGPVANARPIDTSTPGLHTFTVTAYDHAGGTATTSTTYTVQAISAKASVTGLGQSAKLWREHKPRHKPKKRLPIGTKFKFTLNEDATVTLLFTQVVPGRKVKSQCAKQTKKNRHRPSCKRSVVAGIVTVSGVRGSNSVAFSGKVSGQRTLKPGTYTLVIATAGGSTSSAKRLTFTIAR
jgi:hypothetical protein